MAAATKAKQERPGGEWESPVTSDLITAGSKALSDPSFGAAGVLYWLESRPAERGRTVVVARAPGGASSVPVDVTPPLPEEEEAPFFNVRTVRRGFFVCLPLIFFGVLQARGRGDGVTRTRD